MPLPDAFRSTRFRIALAYVVLFSASVAILFGVLYWSVTREMTGSLREQVEQDTRPLVRAFAEGRTRRLIEAIRERTESARPGEAVYLLQTAGGRPLVGNVAPTAPHEGWRELFLRLGNSEPRQGRNVIALGVDLEGAFLLVGRSLQGVEDTQRLLRRSLAWTLGATALLGLAGAALLGRGALRRVEAINRTTQAIIAGDLSRRFVVQNSSDELDTLAANINHMLDRIEELVEGLRQVSSDIAHDLRTPLGRLRQGLETARRRETTVEGHKAALDRAIEETDTILDTFNALLRIAQIEAGARKANFTAVDLSDLVTTLCDAYQSVVEEAGLGFAAEIASGQEIQGDRDLLSQSLANLIENTIRHCPAGTRVSVTLAAGVKVPCVTVADNGPGIPAAERDKVLQRFYRLESSRTTPGSGLGLALVRAVAALHDAELRLSDSNPGLSVSLTFGTNAAA